MTKGKAKKKKKKKNAGQTTKIFIYSVSLVVIKPFQIPLTLWITLLATSKQLFKKANGFLKNLNLLLHLYCTLLYVS